VRSLRSKRGQRASRRECNLKTAGRSRSVIGASAVLAAMSVLVALIGAAPASADENGCPTSNSIGNRLPSDLVGASFTTSGNTATYTFDSLVDRSPTNGVPGLIAYCVYPGSVGPDTVTTSAIGADNSAWVDPPGFDNFSFERPTGGGNGSNIPLDGTLGTTMGTATWSGGVPQNQTIVLHINDEDECTDLYDGGGDTCFVLPAGTEAPDVTTALHYPDHSPVPFDGAYPNFQATAGAIVHDSATVGGTTNGTPTGSVEFRQFTSSDCSGVAADTETVSLNGGSADQTHSYGPINQQSTLSFQAIYTSNDTSKWTNAVSACEKLTVVCQITFVSDRTGNDDIYLMNGSVQTRLTSNPANDGEPAFYSAAGKLAFASSRDGNWEIYSMNAIGKSVTRLTAGPTVDTAPAWSPDGTKIAFTSKRTGNGDIYVMNADGTDQVRLTTNDAADRSPAWSPDGTKIAFASKRTGNGDIYVMNADGTGQVRRTGSAAVDSSPDWSPDGNKIAFASGRTGNGDIYLIDGNDRTRLTTNGAVEGEPSFAQHAKVAGKIDFVSGREGDSEIYAINASGARWRLTTNTALDSAPDAP
jgi:Tol biopolymer transport system component